MSEKSTYRQSSTADPVAVAVVHAVADHEGICPTEVEPPLHETVDPDALNSLFVDTGAGPLGTAQQVSFPYAGYAVQVTSDGEITVSDQ